MIRVVLEASPGVLNERDLATGNTVSNLFFINYFILSAFMPLSSKLHL